MLFTSDKGNTVLRPENVVVSYKNPVAREGETPWYIHAGLDTGNTMNIGYESQNDRDEDFEKLTKMMRGR